MKEMLIKYYLYVFVDSYLFSRISSDSISEKSMDSLTSIKEQREKISD
jgi:hypothetical protein